jgi:plasmid maintenance system antidote protein VapI
MQQLSLSLEPGLAQRYRNLRECFATCVYRIGLGRVAAAIDVQPSNLSAMLSGDRNLDTDLVERYMTEFKDRTPAEYWAAAFLQDSASLREQAMAQIPGLVADLNRLLAEAKG